MRYKTNISCVDELNLNSAVFTPFSVNSNISLNLSVLNSTTPTIILASNSSCLPALILNSLHSENSTMLSYYPLRNSYHKAQVLVINIVPEHIYYLRIFLRSGDRSQNYINHLVVHLVLTCPWTDEESEVREEREEILL